MSVFLSITIWSTDADNLFYNWSTETLNNDLKIQILQLLIFQMPLIKFRLCSYIYIIYHFLETILLIKIHTEGFPGGAVVENLPANAGDTGSSPGLGRSHMPRSN